MGTNTSRNDNGFNSDEKDENKMRRNAELVKDLAERNNPIDRFRVLFDDSDDENQFENSNQIEIDGTIYDLNQVIGEGGFGKVYRGKSRKTNRFVAIKILTNTKEIKKEIDSELEFLNLTKQISMRNHPIIEYYGYKATNDQIYIAMELAQSDLFTFWFNQKKKRNADERFQFGLMIIIYVLRALIFLEKLNIIHGDIKPQNLVIVQGKNQAIFVKLIDFGTVEKMFTKRNQLTVAVEKPYTLFFASPEFLKRDANHLFKRHLHKKSDAWAAGVMFYVLFFEKLPWKDQYDYENFCNDPHARDVHVPREGGFQLIIELLLKKDPNQRSSAKATFMQIKNHPQMGQFLKHIQQTFYPVEDILDIHVPDHVRQQLTKFGKNSNSMGRSDPSFSKGGGRRPCRYGKDCYNKDSDHRQDFIHPGDRDFHPSNLNNQTQKIECRYGTQCFRHDTEHRRKYLHPNQQKFNSTQSKEDCWFKLDCTNHEFEHRQKYRHPNDHRSFKETCRYGNQCNKQNDPQHMQRFLHN